MSGPRAPAVAGRFYPADPGRLAAVVRGHLGAAGPTAGPLPTALVAPHAGYPFSGPVAGSAYALVAGAGAFARVALLGPSHHVAFDGLALPECAAFDSPLGEHGVDGPGARALARLPFVTRSERAHRDEHSLEVHLPFLRETLGPLPILPLVTGFASPEEVAAAIESVWREDTLVVVSSDLSHFLPYETAREVDRGTARAVERLDADALSPERACGATALRGLLVAARKRGLRARCVDLRNSGDTSGSMGRVVGYGAFGFWAA